MTGIAGVMYAFSYAITKSLYLPIGIHFGWNLVSMLFSNGPLGKQLFFLGNVEQPQGLLSSTIFLFQVFATPLIIMWYLKRMRTELSSE
jgi:membrane protease YdiL (CAAX protease family)